MPPEPTKAKLKRKSSRRETEDFRFDGGHAREIEQKRINGQISCAECRRLKIKCDKQIPCQSCQRRGCAALCPNGSLATGQGTRFVLAATEHLHRRISKMSERIRQLEDALASLQSQHSTEPHPLLRDDLLGVNQDRDDDYAGLTEDAPGPSNPPEIIDTFGTLSITDHGISRFFGPTGGSECLLMSDNVSSRESSNSQTPERQRDSKSPSLPQKVVMFSHAFPFTPMGPVAEVRELIEGQLPSWERARYLSESYLDGAAWLFRGVNRDQLMDEILPVYYSSSPVKPLEEHNSAHELALLFVVFAVGALVDLTQEPGNVEAEHYHQIARAAICLQPVLEKPSLTTIQALHLLSVYNAMSGNEFSSKEASMETTWSLIILAAHLSQTIGLHRDSVKWGLPPKVVQRRRGLFWDIFVADAWHALSTGRPPSFSLAYIDCRYPETRSSRPPGQGDDEANFDTWNFRFAAECVAEVASRTLTAETPTYATIMELDRKVREFPIPETAAAMATSVAGTPMMTVSEDNLSLSDSMGNCTLSHTREVILLYIHRSFFAQAIIEYPVNPLKSPYAPSFLAAYRASSTILRTIQAQFVAAPALCSRFWTMWTFAFSAAIVFGTIVTRGPRSPLASNAMTELDNACILFSKAAAHSPRAARALPILTKLSEKAHHALSNVQSGQSSASQGQFWSLKEEENDDELAIFSGRTRFVSAKRAAGQTPSEPVDQPVQMNDPPYAPPPPPPSHSAEPTPPVSYYPERASTTPSMRNWMQEQPSHYAQRREYVPAPETTVPSHGASQYQSTRLCYYPHTPQNHQPQASQPQSQHHRHQPQQAQHPHHQHEQGPSVSGPSDFTWRSQANIPQQYNDSAFPVSQPHGATYQQQQQHYDSSSSTAFHAVKPPPELTELGLVSQDSRLDERWASFMQDSGYLDGFSYRTR